MDAYQGHIVETGGRNYGRHKQGRKRNGEGNVRQRANGLWEARIVLEDGKSKSYYSQTKAEALKKLRDAMHALDRGLPVALWGGQGLNRYKLRGARLFLRLQHPYPGYDDPQVLVGLDGQRR